MLNRCRLEVNAAREGRGLLPLTDAQTGKIDARMAETMRRLARADVDAWRAMPQDARMLAAAQQAMADIKAEAARKVENAQRQAMKAVEVENRLEGAMARQAGWSRSRALVEDMQRTNGYIDGVKRDNVRGLMDTLEAAESRQGASGGRQALMVLFDAENPGMTRDLALEVFARGEAGTGNQTAKAGAEAWLKVTEAMRQRFNAAGGDVRKLDYGYLPQLHDDGRVLAAGVGRWSTETLPKLDRSRYLREDGSRLNDGEVLDLLRGAWESISTDGANKSAPGAFRGTGARANRGGESREIHFKDGESYLAYMRDFGSGSMYDAMIGHVGGMARDIGLVERYGPNPEAQMRVQFDLALRADGPRAAVTGELAEAVAGPRAQWAVLSGASGQGPYGRIAAWGQHTRNVQVFGKLQGAVISSITDLGTMFVTTGYNRLPYFEALANIGRAAGRETREFLDAHGMIAESMVSDLNRWSGDNVAHNWSGRVAAATMRLSLMNAWTDTLRRGFALTMMSGTGRLAKNEWGALSEWDRYRMESKGLTEADWGVLRAAAPVEFRGMQMITPEAIYATGNPDAGAIVAKYIGMITDESEIAVLNPDLTTRAITSGGGVARGTVGGELARSVAQFKSFPVAMISRHWRRMLDTPQGLDGAPVMTNRLAYSGALMVSLTALGAVVFQTKQVLGGKDPVDMTTGKFWARALAQGGGLGFVGDMLLTDTSDDRSQMESFGRAFMGPTFGSAADLFELTKGNNDEAIAGKKTHAGAEAVRFARSHAPLVNLWYAKAALDHAGLHALQENMSPGYLSQIESKHRKAWRGDWWWAPGQGVPERAPSFEDVAGAR